MAASSDVFPNRRRKRQTSESPLIKTNKSRPMGRSQLKALLPEHILIIADAIATNLILAHDERDVSAVFDVIEPLARELAEQGRTPGGRRSL